MSRRARELMRVVAVVVKPCNWKQTRAADFKLLPRDGIPPEGWSSSDAAYVNVAQGIGEVIKAVRREVIARPAMPDRAPSKPTGKRKRKPNPAQAKSTTVRPGKIDAKPARTSRKQDPREQTPPNKRGRSSTVR